MIIKKLTFLLIIFLAATPFALAKSDQPKDQIEQGFLKGSEAYILFLKRTGDEKYFLDQLVNKEYDTRLEISLWRNSRNNVTAHFGAQSLLAPNRNSNFQVSLVSFQLGFSHYFNLDRSGRYKIRTFLIHRSQHALDLSRMEIDMPPLLTDQLDKNVFIDLNILGSGVERLNLDGDKWPYNFRVYLQPFSSKIPDIFDAKRYNRKLFFDGETFLPLPFFREHLSLYGLRELGSPSLGIAEIRLYPIKNLVTFLRQSFIPAGHEALVTPHQGVMYRGLKLGFAIRISSLSN